MSERLSEDAKLALNVLSVLTGKSVTELIIGLVNETVHPESIYYYSLLSSFGYSKVSSLEQIANRKLRNNRVIKELFESVAWSESPVQMKTIGMAAKQSLDKVVKRKRKLGDMKKVEFVRSNLYKKYAGALEKLGLLDTALEICVDCDANPVNVAVGDASANSKEARNQICKLVYDAVQSYERTSYILGIPKERVLHALALKGVKSVSR